MRFDAGPHNAGARANVDSLPPRSLDAIDSDRSTRAGESSCAADDPAQHIQAHEAATKEGGSLEAAMWLNFLPGAESPPQAHEGEGEVQ